MPTKSIKEAQNPLILRCHRLIEAFTKSDDERDFYLDRQEGFIIYVDLDKSQEDLELLEDELRKNSERYLLVPKLTFYETKKIMEGFVNEKVYDIDTKEKLLEIIQSKEARDNFLEFIYDHHAELEKWQQFYQERFRIRIIEWLRNHQFNFVFEEDLEIQRPLIEKVKKCLFDSKVGKDIAQARKTLQLKAKSYYSNEALNPRPKRGRPPKQAVKQEIEPQVSMDIYTTVPSSVRPFLFVPDINSFGVTFSSKFENEEDLIAFRKHAQEDAEKGMNAALINQKLAELRSISGKWIDSNGQTASGVKKSKEAKEVLFDEDEEDDDDEDVEVIKKPLKKAAKPAVKKLPKASKPNLELKKVKPIKAVKKTKVEKVPVKKGKIKLMDSKTAKGKPKQQIKSKSSKTLSITKNTDKKKR